jgi:hypothetical protein
VKNLDNILAPLDQRVPLPRAELSQLRENLLDQSAKAPDPQKPAYRSAIAVCDAIGSAMDEREKAIASLRSSDAVRGTADLGAHRIDNPTKREMRRERREELKRKDEAADKDSFLVTQVKTSWIQRTHLLRQNITQLSSREREAETAAEKN